MNVWYFHLRGEARAFRRYEGSADMAVYEATREAVKLVTAVFVRTPEGVLWDVCFPVKAR